ncbi:MAG: hypothetical protein MUE94_02570 [Verrucomicrobia bacterium]|nr:hypothetical protein [Verrucomicrobiota bacterium]
MSINPETDLNLDELFQPAWAKGSDSKNPYAKYEPRERPEREERRGGDRFRRDMRRDRPPTGRDRGPGRPDRGPAPKGGFQGRPWSERPERRETPPPLPEINVALHAEDKGAESLARQIKTTGRAYPLFDIASMILQKPERYSAVFTVKKGPEGTVIQPLFSCALDDSLWFSEDEAVAHVLAQHLGTFYQTERTQTDPPKGTYTFVAQCGMSGVILGPPNHHDYQTKLRELHAARFSRLPFEAYKARVKIVRDEAVVKQWVEEQSWKTEYVCLNVPEAARLPDLAAVEKHFREVHLPTIIREVESHTLSGPNCNKLRGGLYRVFRTVLDAQRRFPMQVATSLSQQFASRGLQFFKVNKTVTHVWVARPTFLDLENEPVSENVRRIVQFINEHPKCTRRQVVETLAPAPAPVAPPSPVSAEPNQGEASGEALPPKPAAAPAVASEPTLEQAAIIADLHWLVHQGHVIEFANGLLETAKKPAPRPQPAPKKEKAKPESARPETESKPAGQPVPESAAQPPAPGLAAPQDASEAEVVMESNSSEPQPATPAASPELPPSDTATSSTAQG